jgi:hypothetical protein
MTEPLFSVAGGAIATTSDDCYTPRWVFDAMGLRFDLDVAAPVGGPWHVPCDRYLTAEDDGLAQPWDAGSCGATRPTATMPRGRHVGRSTTEACWSA